MSLIVEKKNGGYVRSIEIDGNIAMDWQSGFFLHPNNQVDYVCKELLEDETLGAGAGQQAPERDALAKNGNSPTGITTVTRSPAAIERDSVSRPLRRGCVPVEQRELQVLKSYETDLKRLRRINRQNTLKASLNQL
ncbi:uncharacterized protein LOC110176107 [Drosophila serrata]|uniref:uncharacterized protein LOC110176107 n=1 Tax=Drosophila serrata TaxID=7274 RepID=UPI000A1D1B65|nr:uncharacterized protein LOC110176107 [Drosophila serrata]